LLGAFLPGRLSEIVGSRSSGGTSLLQALVARATASGRRVALVDGPDAFDPASAVAAGVDLGRLLWVKCGGRLRAALAAADLLARCPGFALVTLDLGEGGSAPASAYVRLQRAVAGSGAMLVIRAPRHVTGSAAALVVSMRGAGSRWMGLPRPMRLAGLVSEARVLHARGGPLPPVGEGVRIEWEP
jgi:RecA/RadA recombinase